MYPKIQRHYSVFTMVKNKLTFRNAFSIIRVSLLVITELLAKDNIVWIFFNNISFGNIFQFNWGLTVVHWYTVCQKVWVNYIWAKVIFLTENHMVLW